MGHGAMEHNQHGAMQCSLKLSPCPDSILPKLYNRLSLPDFFHDNGVRSLPNGSSMGKQLERRTRAILSGLSTLLSVLYNACHSLYRVFPSGMRKVKCSICLLWRCNTISDVLSSQGDRIINGLYLSTDPL